MNKYLKPQYEYLYVTDKGDLIILIDTLDHVPRKSVILSFGGMSTLDRVELLDYWLIADSYNNFINYNNYNTSFSPPPGTVVMIESEISLISKITTYFKKVLKEL